MSPPELRAWEWALDPRNKDSTLGCKKHNADLPRVSAHGLLGAHAHKPCEEQVSGGRHAHTHQRPPAGVPPCQLAFLLVLAHATHTLRDLVGWETESTEGGDAQRLAVRIPCHACGHAEQSFWRPWWPLLLVVATGCLATQWSQSQSKPASQHCPALPPNYLRLDCPPVGCMVVWLL